MKPGSAILNPYPSDIPKEEEIKNAPSVGKIMVTIFWDKKGVVLLKFLPRRITMNSDPYSKTLRNPNAGLRRRRATKKKVCSPSMTALSFTRACALQNPSLITEKQ